MNRFSLLIFTSLLSACSPFAVQGGDGRINPDGTIDFSIHFRYPPTPADVMVISSEVVAAGRLVWDATEGRMRFGTVVFTAGIGNDSTADVWLYLQPGRANSSRRPGGSFGYFQDALNVNGVRGHHITAYRTEPFDSLTLAHEFGHLAFGLSDEYSEPNKIPCTSMADCSRSPLSCVGMGKCIESPDAQNQCLMQAEGDDGLFWTEFCTVGNHDMVRGDGIDCPLPMGAVCMPLCSYWNSLTMGWEVTLQQHVNNKSCWQQLHDTFSPRVRSFGMPMGLPQADPPAGYMIPRILDQTTAMHAQTVILVLDRSGSMSDHPDRDRGEICDDGVDTDGNGDDNTPNCSSEYRFDYMKAAARGWLELARNQGVQAGVISFNDNATPHGISAQLLDDAVTDTLGRTVSDLIWGGDTAIGSALQLAPAMFAATPNVRTKSVLLITDGDNNRGPDPLSVANTLREQNIRVFSVATGRASRSGILGDIADRTGGEFANSESARTLVNAFSRQWARQRGLVEIIPELYYKYPLTNRFTFPIAAGVSKVSLILAGNMDDMSGFGLHTIFDGPPGPGTSHFDTLVPHSQLRVVNDTFFQLIEILAPNPGTWDVEILPAAGAAEVQTGHLTLLAEDEQARLYAVLDRHVVTDPTVPVTLTITPIYHTFLRNLAALSAVVRRPDGTTITLPLVTAPDDLMYTGAITDLSQQGAYKVEVFMRTGPGTSNDPGESRWARLPPNSVSVPSYEAMAVENFVVRIPGGPLPNDTPDSATRLPLNNGCAVAQGNFTPENVQDYYQFSAPSGARVWATVDTGGSFTPPPTSRDSLLTIFKADGATIIEEDDNDGSGNGCDSTQESADASAIAGRTLVDGGTYFLRVQPSIRNEAYLSYQLFLNITTNPPLAESEPNNIPAEANTLVSGGEMMGLRSGSLSPSGELDYYAVSAPAGSLLHVSADVDPLRDGTSLTDLGLSLIAPDGSTVLYSADSSADPLPGESTAEGFCYRVAEAGVYYVIAFGKAAGTGRYDLMVAVKPSRSEPLILTMVPARVGSDFQFSFPTQPRVLYWVEQASTLKGPWTPWPAITGSGGVEVFRVPLSTGQSFFRLSTSP